MGIKKIGILCFNTITDGGVFQYTLTLLELLNKTKNSNYKFVIFCFDKSNFDLYSNVEVRLIKKNESNIFVRLIRLFFILFKIRSNYFFTKNELKKFSDIDLFYSPVSAIYPHFYLRIPFFYTFHDLQDKYYPDNFSKLELFLRHITNKVLTKFSEYIICESDYVRNDIIKHYKIINSKIHVLKSPPTSGFLKFNYSSNSSQIVKSKYQLPDEYFYYPAQTWQHKNHINLLLAFKKVLKKYKNIHLILSGTKKNNHKNIISNIRQLDLNNCVTHIGYANSDDLPYIYHNSIALIMPSLFESISIPIYESFALKVPVCCSNIYGITEQVENAGLLFDPNSVDDIANKMLQILENPILRSEIVSNGYRIISSFNDNFFSTNFIDKIDYYFENVKH